MVNKDLGYDDRNVVMIGKWGVEHKNMNYFKDQLLQNPNIQSVAFRNNGNNMTVAKINGDKEIEFGMDWIDDNFLPLFKIPILQGRNFSTNFPTDTTTSVMVNEAFVKEAGWKNPVGQIVDFWYNNKKLSVVGVFKDYHYGSVGQKIRPQLFKWNPKQFGLFAIKIKEGSAASVLPFLEKTYKSTYPLNPYAYEFKDLSNRQQYENESKWKKVMLFGACLTIFISAIGLFGLSVLSAEKRLKEIGIRKILGASVATVITSLSKDFLKLVVIALVIAIPIAWLLSHKWLEHYPYRTTLSVWIFAAAGFGIILIALLTVGFQAIKAAIGNPVKSLRTE
jgi:putative ABC transport system permease protein